MQGKLSTIALLVLSLVPSMFAQAPGATGTGQRGGGAAAPTPPRPTPRKADGKPSLGMPYGENALWLPAGGGGERFIAADNAAPTPEKPRVADLPMQPWTREMYNYRNANQLEPHTRCKPSGGPRQFLTPYGVEIVEIAHLQQIFIMDLGGPHTYRNIYMDGRSHPADFVPTYYGHSTGRWDGDTLVIDTVGMNEKFWLDRQGIPHTEKLHMVERLTRTDYNTIKYEVTIDDPGAYTKPWTSGFFLRWTANSELFEYVCQDNNFAAELMVGTQEYVDRTSKIVP
jgi:hypothetical protein